MGKVTQKMTDMSNEIRKASLLTGMLATLMAECFCRSKNRCRFYHLLQQPCPCVTNEEDNGNNKDDETD